MFSSTIGAIHLLFFVFLIFLNGKIHCRRIQDEINVYLDANFYCFRILNGTHQTGCQSPLGGSQGIIQLIKDQSDVDSILSSQPLFDDSPLIVAAFLKMFRDVPSMDRLEKSGRLSGFIVLHADPDEKDKFAEDFSEDAICPNKVTSLYAATNSSSSSKQCTAWNPLGTELRFIDWQIPVFYVYNRTEIDFVVKYCYNKINKGSNSSSSSNGGQWPLCAAELMSFFSAAKDSRTCMRRNELFAGLHSGEGNCDPLGDQNLHIFLPYTNKSAPAGAGTLAPSSVVVLAARMDSFSTFYNLVPGHLSSVAGVVIMLTVAEALGRMVPLSFQGSGQTSKTFDKHLLFVLFNGESLDYIGSSRMVFDMTNDKFPELLNDETFNQSALFNTSHIDLFIELEQPLNPDLKEKFYLYTDPEAYKNNSVKAKVDKAAKMLTELFGENLTSFDSNSPLPPSSVQSFLRVDRSIPSLVLSGHDRRQFSNKFYNSFLDTLQLDRELIELENEYDLVKKNSDELIDKLKQKRQLLLDNVTNVVEAVSQNLLNFIRQYVFLGENESSSLNAAEKTPSVPKIIINKDLARRFTNCFFDWPFWNCTIFRRINQIEKILSSKEQRQSTDPKRPSDEEIGYQYASAHTGVNTSTIRYYANAILPLFFGDRVDWSGKAPSECTQMGYGTPSWVTMFNEDPKTRNGIMSYMYAQNYLAPEDGSEFPFKPFCVMSPVRKTNAKSPAFEIPDYDLAWLPENGGQPKVVAAPNGQSQDQQQQKSSDNVADRRRYLVNNQLTYSTWTESRWQKFSLKLFLQPNPRWELGVFLAGAVFFVFCLILGYALSRTTPKLFQHVSSDLVTPL